METTVTEIEQNKGLTRRIYEELFGQGNLDVVDEIFAEDFVWHSPAGPESAWHLKQAASAFHEAFPDVVVRIEDQVAENDRVVTRVHFSGTNTGPFQNRPATGRRFSIGGIGIDRIEDGKIAERWNEGDNLTLLQQLGFWYE